MNHYVWVLFVLLSVFSFVSCQERKNVSVSPSDIETTRSTLKISEEDTLGNQTKITEPEAIIDTVERVVRGQKYSEDSKILRRQETPKGTVETKSDISGTEILQSGNEKEKVKHAQKPAVKPDTAIIEQKKIIRFQNGPDHELFSRFLKKYVSDEGWVNYTGMSVDKSLLTSYIKSLEGPFDMKAWTTHEKLAFWINVYNAYTIKLVLENYPITSIRNIYDGKPWSQAVIYANATYYSLDDIQKNIIMKQFGDPRIHFAINCAARSCPPLLNKAYTKNNLEFLLETRTKSFINGDFNKIKSRHATLSPIFQWYSEDFGDVYEFINKYSLVAVNDKTKISFSDYDWSLNGK